MNQSDTFMRLSCKLHRPILHNLSHFNTVKAKMSTNNFGITPKVLSIQSHTVHGYVGNKAATFPLQTLGFNVDCINTITLSNEPGYAGGFKGQTMSGSDLGALVEGLEGNELLNHDVIITGYTRTHELLNQIENTVKKVKLNNPKAMYICDPVMGDNGKYYVPEALCEVYRTQILPLATAITPNLFEAQELSGVTINSLSDAVKACKVLLDVGPKIVLLTGLKLQPNDVASISTINSASNAASVDESTDLSVLLAYRTLDSFKNDQDLTTLVDSSNDIHIYRLDVPKIDSIFSGCGDLFSSLLSAGLFRCRDQLTESPHLLASVLDTVTHAMSAVLLNTRNRQTEQKHTKELRIIESRDIFIEVEKKYEALLVASSEITTQINTHKSRAESAAVPTSYVAVSSAISGIILDMDGTLTEPGAIDFSAMYSRNGLIKTPDSDILASIAALSTESERAKAMEVILDEERLGCERMELRTHLHGFLNAAKKSRVRLALTTRNCETSLEKFISLSNVHESTFYPRLTRDTLNGVNKPDPEVAHHIFRQWSVEPGFEGTVWFVGDSIDDMLCGRNAGCKTCLIRTPYNAHLTVTSSSMVEGKEVGSVVDLVVEDLEEFARKINLSW